MSYFEEPGSSSWSHEILSWADTYQLRHTIFKRDFPMGLCWCQQRNHYKINGHELLIVVCPEVCLPNVQFHFIKLLWTREGVVWVDGGVAVDVCVCVCVCVCVWGGGGGGGWLNSNKLNCPSGLRPEGQRNARLRELAGEQGPLTMTVNAQSIL